jgi:hypothetical protein
VWFGLAAACGGDDAGTGSPAPVVDEIDDAFDAVAAVLDEEPRYFEVAADLDLVRMFVATDDGAVAYEYVDGDLSEPSEPIPGASGATFASSAVDLDPDRIWDGLRDELDDPTIVDLAIQGGADGSVVYDATVLSDSGGVLLVLLAGDGAVLAVQAA